MNSVTCPFCDARVPPQEVAEGWCEACGKKLPPALLPAAPVVRPATPSNAADNLPTRGAGRGVKWGYLVGAAATALLGVALLVFALVEDGPGTTPRSRRVRAVEKVLGEKGTGVVCGLILIGLGGYLAYKGVGADGTAGT